MEIKCNHCDKLYASYQSRCNHIRRYHKQEVSLNGLTSKSEVSLKNLTNKSKKNIEIKKDTIEIKVFQCKFCNNIYKHKQSKYKHEKNCKEIKKDNEIEKIKQENIEIKQEINLLKSELHKGLKIKNQTNNVNHGTIININGLGMESILPKLTKEEKIDILTSLLFKEIPAIELIRKIYNNDKFIEDRNTIINNLQSKTCLVYNAELEKFDAKNKNTHIEDMIDWRNKDIKKMMDEMKDSPKIKKYTRKLIEDYIDNTEEIKKTVSYKKYKEEIIYIIYNCKEFMKKLYNQQITNL